MAELDQIKHSEYGSPTNHIRLNQSRIIHRVTSNKRTLSE